MLTDEQRKFIAQKYHLDGIYAERRAFQGADKMVYSITAILVAFALGEVSEGMAANLMCCDRLRLRQIMNELCESAEIQCTEWRQENPPQVQSQEATNGDE